VTRPQAVTPVDPEIAAISVVYDALQHLDTSSQQRVLDYVAGKLGLALREIQPNTSRAGAEASVDVAGAVSQRDQRQDESSTGPEDLEGISPVAIKWMRRNNLTADGLARVFSLGVDEIDLVARTVPGRNKKDRMHSVLLLKGIASYLGTGVPRVSHEQVKEACLHYDAFDTANFARNLSAFAAEVSGSKESGYTLTARGVTAATDLLRGMLEENKKN
jgi:hypothetical protein